MAEHDDLDAIDVATRNLALRINPLVRVPARSSHDTRRLRAVVEMRGWDVAQRQYPEVARILAELRAGLHQPIAAEVERIAESLHTSCRIDDMVGTIEAGARNGVRRELLARAAELQGGAR